MVDKSKLSPAGRRIIESAEDALAFLRGDKSRATMTTFYVGDEADAYVDGSRAKPVKKAAKAKKRSAA